MDNTANTSPPTGFGPGIEVVFSHIAPDGAKVYVSNVIQVIGDFCETPHVVPQVERSTGQTPKGSMPKKRWNKQKKMWEG